jgi:hypothetical protein
VVSKQIKHNVSEPRPASKTIESRALYFGGAIFIVITLVCLNIFWGKMTPIFGFPSVGSIGSISASLAAFIAFIIAYPHLSSLMHGKHLNRLRAWLKLGALAFAHASLFFLISVIGFYVIQSAFEGLLLDAWSSSIIVGVVCGLSCYSAYLMGARITSVGVSMVLAMFLLSGSLASMITSQDPQWWMLHFSSLGGDDTLSSYTFNLTLIIGGIVIATLADFIASDFARLQIEPHSEYAKVKVNVIRIMLAAIGVLLAFVGLFVWDEHLRIHNASASGMVLTFIILICMLPKLVPDFPKSFFIFSFSLIGAIVACYWLWSSVGYFNLTAVELLCALIVFSWVIVFVRHISAGLEDKRH